MAWSLVGHNFAQASGGVSGGASVNSTGADLIVAVLAGVRGGSLSVTDNKGNTYTQAVTGQGDGNFGSGSMAAIYYSQAPAVGSGHTFSTPVTSNDALFVGAFSGSHATPLDVSSGSSSFADTTSIQAGSITPAAVHELIVAGLCAGTQASAFSINSSMSITDSAAGSTGNYNGGGMAWLDDTTASAINPTWSWTGTAGNGAAIAAFKPAAGGGFTAKNRRTLGPRVGSRGFY